MKKINKFNKYISIEKWRLEELSQWALNYKTMQNRLRNYVKGYLDRKLEEQTRYILEQILKEINK